MMWHHYYAMMGFPMGGLVLTLLVFLAAAGVVVYALRRPGSPDSGRDAAAILAERYARGEIDDEEYHRRLNRLRTS
ncbi:SHOCT domain-containing protein [Dactylosporangium sp. McL0621]|uniref:SHOCT domain-containing protein n=1 Tax=Dactylosporangium sp. McL0621 TaxID=3415678 RepID=UPI003CF9A665